MQSNMRRWCPFLPSPVIQTHPHFFYTVLFSRLLLLPILFSRSCSLALNLRITGRLAGFPLGLLYIIVSPTDVFIFITRDLHQQIHFSRFPQTFCNMISRHIHSVSIMKTLPLLVTGYNTLCVYLKVSHTLKTYTTIIPNVIIFTVTKNNVETSQMAVAPYNNYRRTKICVFAPFPEQKKVIFLWTGYIQNW